MSAHPLIVRVLKGFDDPTVDPGTWNTLLASGPSDLVFLTREWQEAWWKSYHRSGLMLLLAEQDGRPIALAPLFAEEGMVYFVGSGGSDYLDFIGAIDRPGVLTALLSEARSRTPGFAGFLFYHVLTDSPTGPLLQEAARTLDLQLTLEGGMTAPMIDIAAHPEAAQALPRKNSLRRAERELARDGPLEISHHRDPREILSYLPEFMDQHVARWASTDSPSLFLEPAHRDFYRNLATPGGDAGWLRFTSVRWNGQLAAAHFGFNYRGSYLFYKPSFAPALAARSPGQVLMRHLLLAALEEGAHRFDLGLGDEEFKRRFATGTRQVENWGLYPH